MSYIEAKVTGVRRLTPHMSRVTFSGASLVDQAPDQYLKVFFPQPGQSEPVLPAPLAGDEVLSWYRTYLAMPDDVRPPMRTYTVRALRPSAQEVDIDFVLHGDEGPASAWASRASEGDRVAFLGPHGLYDVPPETTWQLLVGDETAIPAIGAIVEALPAGTRAVVYVEISDREDRQVFETQGTVELHWVVRGSGPVGDAVLEAVRKAELPGRDAVRVDLRRSEHGEAGAAAPRAGARGRQAGDLLHGVLAARGERRGRRPRSDAAGGGGRGSFGRRGLSALVS